MRACIRRLGADLVPMSLAVACGCVDRCGGILRLVVSGGGVMERKHQILDGIDMLKKAIELQDWQLTKMALAQFEVAVLKNKTQEGSK